MSILKELLKQMKNDINEPLYSISSAARLLQISVHTLRMYEREGLIIPFRKDSQHRLYSQSDIDRVNCIRNAINSDKLSIAGIQTVYSMVPCWDIKNCSIQDRDNCEAYKGHKKACWMYAHINNVCSGQVCRECNVYKDYSECGRIKESIKTLSKK
jgi:MerR family transcriptional regulator, heat shock protein HspR